MDTKLPPLCVIINEDYCELSYVRQLLDAGIRWLQLRFKTIPNSEMYARSIAIRRLCETSDALLIINDHVALAREVEADGVHLGRNDAQVNAARMILGSAAIIGGTAHNALEYEALQSSEVDYIGLGPYRMTTTKKDLSPLLGFQGVKYILQTQKKLKPVFVVGGVIDTDIAELQAIGVYGVAISSALSRAKNISEAAASLVTMCSRGVSHAGI